MEEELQEASGASEGSLMLDARSKGIGRLMVVAISWQMKNMKTMT